MCASKNIKYYTNKNYNNFETSRNNLLSKQSISHAQEHCLYVCHWNALPSNIKFIHQHLLSNIILIN